MRRRPLIHCGEPAWPDLSDDVKEVLYEAGQQSSYSAGHSFFEVGEDDQQFVYVIEGEIDVLDRLDDHVVGRVTAGHFLGELGLLTGQKTFLAAIARTDVEAIEISREDLLNLIRTVPEIADAVVGAFAARRKLLIQQGEGGMTIVGEEQDPVTSRLLEFTNRNGIPYRFIDRQDQDAVSELQQTCAIPDEGAAVITSHGEVLQQPEPCEVATKLGLDLSLQADKTFDVAIVGAGPGGLAAAVYAASEGLSTIVIEDVAVGGQAGTSSRIENYLGFPSGISGGDLAFRAQVQAIKFGAQIVAPRRAVGLQRVDDHWCLQLEKNESVTAHSVILACGVQWRRLNIAHRARYEGRGIYYAATDLEARYCRKTNAIIVGGGNSAGQAAMYMSRYADCTHVAVRDEDLAESMSSYLADRIHSDERINLLTQTEVVALAGEDRLERVTLRNNATGEETEVACGALFSMIGAEPNTHWLKGAVQLDSHGYIKTGYEVGEHGMSTSAAGVFAVGDIRSGSVKRVASAVGEGSVVVSAVHHYLNTTRHEALTAPS